MHNRGAELQRIAFAALPSLPAFLTRMFFLSLSFSLCLGVNREGTTQRLHGAKGMWACTGVYRCVIASWCAIWQNDNKDNSMYWAHTTSQQWGSAAHSQLLNQVRTGGNLAWHGQSVWWPLLMRVALQHEWLRLRHLHTRPAHHGGQLLLPSNFCPRACSTQTEPWQAG